MRVGFAMLAHDRLDRAAALAGHLSRQGAPVVIHLDRRVPDDQRQRFQASIPSDAKVISTRAADWGRFGLIEATLDCVEALLDDDIDHICLISGSCLPVRPLSDLTTMLADHPATDFIESVSLDADDWVKGGLSRERFTLFHPFSFRTHKRLFDLSVDIQRALRIRRQLPKDVAPHLGLQWWCLSTRTLRALTADPRLPAWKRFFRRSWIPDEGFFQSLVRTVRPEATPKPPIHLARFSPRGRPYVFHDDHAGLLADSGQWFARKIDPDADALYARFLGDPGVSSMQPTIPPSDQDPFAAALQREAGEGRGLITPGRFRQGITQVRVPTLRPYLVLVSDDPDWLAQSSAALAEIPGLAVHDRLFDRHAPAFARGRLMAWGNLPADPVLRDHRPSQFLALTIRADEKAGQRTVFAMTPAKERTGKLPFRPPAEYAAAGQFAGDPNARLILQGSSDRPSQDLLRRLRLPLPAKRSGKVRPPTPLRAWVLYDASAETLAEAANGDWSDPAFWTQPGAKGAP